MRLALVFALALLCLIASIALSFPGQQFFDEEIEGQQYLPMKEICPDVEIPDCDCDRYQGPYLPAEEEEDSEYA